MSPIVNLEEVATLTSITRFFRSMAKEGTSPSALVQVGDDRTKRYNLAAYIAAGCPRITIPSEGGEAKSATSYELATEILGRDFITPKKLVARCQMCVYDEVQLDVFKLTLPLREGLEWLRDNNYILLPGPNSPMSLLDIGNLNILYLAEGSGGWYARERQAFSRNDKVGVRWIALRKVPVPDSCSTSWDGQQSLLSDVEFVPNAAEAAWCILMYKAVRNNNLLRSVSVRTSSLAADGNHVNVGYFEDRGLEIINQDDNCHFKGIGLASARKF